MAKFSNSLFLLTLLCALLVVESSLESQGIVLIAGNSTILSQNNAFELGFFSYNGGLDWYLGMWYATLPIRTYVWVASREQPVKNLTSAKVRLTDQMEVVDSNGLRIWQTDNVERATQINFLDTGNLVLLSEKNETVWESFHFPTDTWLPGMNITRFQSLTSWRNLTDPSPGYYTLRLTEYDYGGFELVFNHTNTYWLSDKWDGSGFPEVPESSIPFINSFSFESPFTNSASLIYPVSTENSFISLTRFSVDLYGQLIEYKWSIEDENWNSYWSRPSGICNVYGLCGNFGFCSESTLTRCECLTGFQPTEDWAWKSGDFTGGCRQSSESHLCDENDWFEEVGTGLYDNTSSVLFQASQKLCEETCLKNCTCLGLSYDKRSGTCKNLYGLMLNFRNSTRVEEFLYFRVTGGSKKNKSRRGFLIGGVCGLVVVLVFILVVLVIWHRRSKRSMGEEIELFPPTN